MSMSRIVLLLDESGSMNSQKMEVVDGINKMFNAQRELNPDGIQIDIFKFNTKVTHFSSGFISSMKPFTSNDYNPSDMTALNDAIGQAIHKYHSEEKVLMVIVTDGMENASKEYNHASMVAAIENQRKNKNWQFIYLSENPETVQQGHTYGFNNKVKGHSNVCIGYKQSGKHMGSSTFNSYLSKVCQAKTNLNYDEWQKL